MDGLGKLLLYRARPYDLVDHAILFQTCARGKIAYVHSAFLYPDGETVIESCFRYGVHQRRFDDARFCDRFDIKGMMPGDWDRVLVDAEKEIDKLYDARGIVRFMTRTEGADDNHWFCSELTEEKLAERGFPLLSPDRVQPWQVAPMHQGMSNELILKVRAGINL